jgi:phosphotransacetylase
MADREQMTGAILDGPLAYDNAVSKEAASIKGIRSQVASDADIFLVLDLETGIMLAQRLIRLGNGSAADICFGRTPSDYPHQPPRSRGVADRLLCSGSADGRRRAQ